jgi:hypothetical protein
LRNTGRTAWRGFFVLSLCPVWEVTARSQTGRNAVRRGKVLQPALSVSSEKRARLGHALPRSGEAALAAWPRNLRRISLKQILRLGRSMLALAVTIAALVVALATVLFADNTALRVFSVSLPVEPR